MDDARDRFAAEFGDSDGVSVARAPGRVNLIGEHTDYNEGWVLPMPIGQCIEVVARRRDNAGVRVLAADLDQRAEFRLGQQPEQEFGWLPYVFGVTRELQQRGLLDRGADLLVRGNVPRGAGLSSSAALEMALVLALQAAFKFELEPVEAARLGQKVEHRYAGVRCGIMDPLVSRLGRADHALLIDCRSLDCRDVPLRLLDHRVVIVDSAVRRGLAETGYNDRRRECEQGVALLREALPSIQALRDVSLEMLQTHAAQLPEPIRSRCRHVVSENARVLDAVACLEAGDLTEFGRLMHASQRSLRDDYEVSHPRIDRLVDAAMACDGVLGARISGGGFGGCTVNLVRRDALDGFSRRMSGCLADAGSLGSVTIVDATIQAGSD